MARLPQASDLQRRTTPANTPDVRAPTIDYSPMARSGAAIGEGMGSIGRGVAAFEARQTEVDDYETKKRLLDFTDRAEQELETYKRQMPAGGDGYAAGWQQRYRELAGEFVGPNDANVPAAQRAKIGLQLKQYERQLHERAWRDENAERDRTELAGLEETVTRQASKVAIDPTRHDDVQREVESLIELNQKLPQPIKDAYRKKARERLSEEAAQAYAARATTKEGLDEARRVLAPNMPDKPETTSQALRGAGVIGGTYVDQIKKFEGYTAKATWDYKQHSVGYGTRAKFPGEVIDKVEAEARLNDELGKAAAIVDKFKPGLDGGTRAALISLTYNAGSDWTTKGLGEAIKAGDLATAKQRFLQYNQAGGAVLPGLANRRRAEASWFGKDDAAGGGQPDMQPTESGGYMDAGVETYAGSIGLPLAKRRAAVAQAESIYRKTVGDVQGSIREQMKASEKGVLPPDDWLKVVEPRIRAINDPETNALYATMLGKAQVTASFRALPPVIQEIQAQRAREELVKSGGTGEQEKYVEHLEKLSSESKTQVANNAIGWASRSQPVIPLVPNPDPEATRLVSQGKHDEAVTRFPGQYGRPTLETLNFGAADIGSQLDRRMATAQGVARYTGAPIQAFAENERTFLGNVLKSGGQPMLSVMGQIAAAAERSNVDASMILKELAPKDAPELSMIGHLVGAKADPRTLTVAAEALKWKLAQGERFESTINKSQAQPSLGEYDKMFATAPTARDSLKSLANLVYEYEARQKGVSAQFDQALYTDITHRLMGQTTDQTGQAYGGVGWQGAGVFSVGAWTDGRWASQILVPPDVKQDRFDDLVKAVRADDLPKIGGIPKDAKGNAYSMPEIRTMSWQSVGPPGAPPIPGVYLLKVKDDAAGRPIYARGDDGNPLVVDLRPVMGELRKRKPSIFAGYSNIEQDQVIPDPRYPSTYTPPAPAPSATSATPEPRTGRDRRSTMPIGAMQ